MGQVISLIILGRYDDDVGHVISLIIIYIHNNNNRHLEQLMMKTVRAPEGEKETPAVADGGSAAMASLSSAAAAAGGGGFRPSISPRAQPPTKRART